MMNRLFVKLIGLLAPLWRGAGADPKAVQLIVAAKLLVGDRGSKLLGKQQSNSKSMRWLTYVAMAFLGGALAFAHYAIPHKPTAFGLIYSFSIIYLCLLLVMEMSESLFDTRDVNMLMSRPITDKTFSLARALHISVFALQVNLALAIIPTIYLGFVDPISIPLFLFGILLTVIIAVAGTLGIYLSVLARLSAERYKKVIGTIQIVISTLFVLIYIVPQTIDADAEFLQGLQLVGEPLGFVFPGLWIGGLHDLASGNLLSIGQGCLALLVTFAAGSWYMRQSEGMGSKLLQMRNTSSAGEGDDQEIAESSEHPVGDRLAGILTSNLLEYASFRFHWAAMLRSQDFKQKVYPSLVFVPIFAVFFLLRDQLSEGTDLRESPGQLLFALYYMAMVIITPLSQLRISELSSAAWLWQVHPVDRRGAILYGQYMASLGQFLLPTLLIIYPIFIYLAGWDFIPSLAFSLAVSLLGGTLFQIVDRIAPLSRTKTGGQFSTFGPTMVVVLLASIFGGIHYGLLSLPWALWGATVLVWVIFLGSLVWLRKIEGGFKPG